MPVACCPGSARQGLSFAEKQSVKHHEENAFTHTLRVCLLVLASDAVPKHSRRKIVFFNPCFLIVGFMKCSALDSVLVLLTFKLAFIKFY